MNMIDYLHWRGDLNFEQSAFNEVDNLIFSYLSYVNLDGIFTKDISNLTIKEASDKFYQIHTLKQVKDDKSFIAAAPIVLLEASKTNRFKDIILYDYINIIDKQLTTQFSAIKFKINQQLAYVAYKGTDDTLIGWKEDLQLSYKLINAQLLAKEYLNKCTNLNQIIVGGHSKGGNLALYAAASCNQEIKTKIIQIYNNDGPNLYDTVIDNKDIESILKLETRIVPEYSVFGLIFHNHQCKQIVIKSSENFIMQHDAMSWEIEGPAFVKMKQVSQESLIIQKAIINFLDNIDLKQREIFVDGFFKAIKDAGFTKMSELSTIGLVGIVKLIHNLSLTRQDEVFKLVSKRLIDTIKEVSSDGLDMITSNASNSLKAILEAVEDDIRSKTKEISENVNDRIKNIIPNKKN